MILLSGLLTNAAEVVASMGIILQATSLVYIFPSALSFAVSTRVGNELGGKNPGRARTSSTVALSCHSWRHLENLGAKFLPMTKIFCL